MLGAVAIVGGLVVIGAESIGHIGPDGVLGDLLFVLTGFMFAVFGTLLRHWRVNAFSAATVISVLSLALLPLYAASGGFARVAALGLGENALQALAQGILAGPAALYLFAFSIQTIGVARAAVFPATVPALTILDRLAPARRAADRAAGGGTGHGAVRILSGAEAASVTRYLLPMQRAANFGPLALRPRQRRRSHRANRTYRACYACCGTGQAVRSRPSRRC